MRTPMNENADFKEVCKLQELCKPVNDWLQKNHNPHTKIIIETDHVELVQELMGAPYEVLD